MSIVRRAVIFVAQILALLFIVVATIGGARGRRLGRECRADVGGIVALMPSASISIAGAIAGFFISILPTALFFVLVEIAHNSRNRFRSIGQPHLRNAFGSPR